MAEPMVYAISVSLGNRTIVYAGPTVEGVLELKQKAGGGTPATVAEETSLVRLGLSRRSLTCLDSQGIVTVEQLVVRSSQELRRIRQFGETSLREVKRLLASRGLHLSGESS